MDTPAEKNISDVRAIIFWYGFPVCGLLMKQVADLLRENVVIVAVKPAMPIAELEKFLGHEVVCLENPNDIWARRDEFGDRNLIIHTGWCYDGWLRYDRYMKRRSGAKTVVAVDNRYRGDVRQWMGALWFRLYLKKYFDAALVPGKSGRTLMRFLGMPDDRIYTGLYGAYEDIFKETAPIETRNKEFLFVGQLITRKSIDILIPAFIKYRTNGGTWNLRIVGDGVLREMCHGDGIMLEPFAQPIEVAKKMNAARVLVLPSRDDNWGTVVCEAAACGMHLITSKSVAAHEDIVESGKNGIVLDTITPTDLTKAFSYYEQMGDRALQEGSKISKEIAAKHDSRAYFTAFKNIVADLLHIHI